MSGHSEKEMDTNKQILCVYVFLCVEMYHPG